MENKKWKEVIKQNRTTDCQKFVTVLLDIHITQDGYGTACKDALSTTESPCIETELSVPRSIQWLRNIQHLAESPTTDAIHVQSSDKLEKHVMIVLPTMIFIEMVHALIQTQMGISCLKPTFTEYIRSVTQQLNNPLITIVIMDMDEYFKKQKLSQQKHNKNRVLQSMGHDIDQEEQAGTLPHMSRISRQCVEEALVDAQLQTDCNIQFVNGKTQLADLVKSFTKSVAEEPIKKNRLESVFSFHCESLSGAKVSKTGDGLLKVWKNQLRQFHTLSADMADAIVEAYPSPKCLLEAYKDQGPRLLESLQVRRGAGLLETKRCIGKEMSRRIHEFMTSDDPDYILK